MRPIWTMQPLKPVGAKVETIHDAPIANDTAGIETDLKPFLKPKFDRSARMREYWAKRREEAK